MINDRRMVRKPPKFVDCKLLLENSFLSNYFAEIYGPKVKVVGSPSLELFAFKGSKYDYRGGILLITRPPDEINFGLTKHSMRKRFIDFVQVANSLRIPVYVKHHPRQLDVSMWSHPGIHYELVDITLNDFAHSLRAVYSFYSSAPVLFASNGIPCFDIGTVQIPDKGLPYHYRNSDGKITHALIECGIINDAQDVDPSISLAQPDTIFQRLGHEASKNVKQYFPANSNALILTEIMKVCEI